MRRRQTRDRAEPGLLTLTLRLDVRPFVQAAKTMAEGFRQLGASMRRLGEVERRRRAGRSTAAPLGHAFMPNLDMACIYPSCYRTAEEH